MSDQPNPTVGRIVHYRLTWDDAAQIAATRAGAAGNPPSEGDVCAAIVVSTWGPTTNSAINLQVLLDGPDSYWAPSRNVGDVPGTWSWPPRV